MTQISNTPIPEGRVMVPVEPTESMIVQGFESWPHEGFSSPEVWEAYCAMSGCQQAAHRAKLCWVAMLAAAPSAPLVAATDNAALLEMVRQFYTLNACRMSDEDIEGDPRMKRARALLAGQVAPQATVEYMENIHELARRLQSKAYNHGNADAGSHYSDNYYRAIAAESDEALAALINACKAIATPPTSKADTGDLVAAIEGLLNAPDEDSFHVACDEARATLTREALKSATPSTIKAEPTGEQ